MAEDAARGDAGPRSLGSLIALGTVALVLIAILLALGTWQVHRRAWKLDLIARVDARVHAPPVPPPGPGAVVTAASDEYRHVRVSGRFLNGKDTLVQAVTDYGPGYWVVTPFETTSGFTVLVNRGFVPTALRDPATRASGEDPGASTVNGLLRLSEPGGAFLRHNDPGDDRWYSRDVAAIAAKRGLGDVASYFIDADGPARPGKYPIGGLTVISFPNSHLIYALTWYGLAAMLAGAVVVIGRQEWRRRSLPASRRPEPA